MLPALLLLAVPGGPWCGFVGHYPFLPEDGPAYRDSGATMVLLRVSWATIQPDAETFDTLTLNQQLDWAEAQGVKVLYVIECGPAHAPNWLRAEVAAAGESMVGADGRPVSDPCIFSPVYRARLDAFVPRVARYLREHPKAATILGYSNGCEWWYPDLHAHGELATKAFDSAMSRKYGDRAKARAAWGLAGDGPLKRPPVVLEGGGAADRFGELTPMADRFDASWMTTGEHVAVAPGEAITFTAQTRIEARRRGFAYLQVAWMGAAELPLAIVNSPMVSAAEWTDLKLTATAPAGANRAWLLMKTCGVGRTAFRAARCVVGEGTEDRLAGVPLKGQLWLSPEGTPVGFEQAGAERIIRIDSPDIASVSPVWIDDWFTFMGDAVAEFIGSIADRLRAADPDRPLIPYLTMSFAAPFCWDYSYEYHIHPEKVFAARDYDAPGMQVASADGDGDHVRAAIDLVRRRGAPWLIDLQDFTAGVHLGRAKLEQVAVDAVRAGARGVVWYGWYDRFVPDYSFRDGWPLADVQGMVAAVRAALAEQADVRVPVDAVLVHPKQPPIPGRGEPDPGRFFLAYKALRQLGRNPLIVARRQDAPAGVPVFTVNDLPAGVTAAVRRSTEAGNTPPMFKLLPTEANERAVRAVAEAWRGRLR